MELTPTEIVMHPDVLFDGWIKYFHFRMKTIEDYEEEKLVVNNLLRK